ncbi:MAG: 30S ribosomal protein S6 [Candidatus Doudnabacteria bacterium RIFCSPHIGHO2_02_FULL_48_21]|uniref:Small ribosomal subunit protein bS6 n=1 Tax=Candidatus Doudnabacteria bacterium RIFCSPLOWO2_02_FULL_48_13 TaxID=1817845 RepID=A0A1F5QCV8_9BACT|nr:MAG: 30S ribosomal protein S6 [Candidatus Doudnabacteria bacterium RIFCSPHIGHO2_01_48_18]OGE91544.1 MAG: 30S ribosomal protein S6 [Candidatus Doudnabacteria bacterium RIFCSPHIGHO2_12_FULL_47_25]OGE93134.1 MAG: 30S ribosomal protein S6 [Candidatus Doudnabacteria bacterium RIFCSPHIGHO2_02_FULL_48_21]OGF00026.1 MAG: 30S ribosomal protein S6 [Candidatus Doudnabacteria bacterium RIFCSPLOWO2_02_FULL_48_13]
MYLKLSSRTVFVLEKRSNVAKYELMYIISNNVSDDEVPKITEEVKKYIETAGGIVEKHEDLGKKKLAYPIKKTRNAVYVLDNFSAPADKINEIEHRIRTYQNVIRHMIINMDEGLIRMEKDKALQAKLKRRIPQEEAKPVEAGKPRTEGKKIEIDLDAEIEKALDSKDLK